jgi:hypothetical protein
MSQLRYPGKQLARKAVLSAVRSGQLIPQPCEVCGDLPSEAHHPDYRKKLIVRWLCLVHHREADKSLGRKRRTDTNFSYNVSPDIHHAGAALGSKGGRNRAKKYNNS